MGELVGFLMSPSPVFLRALALLSVLAEYGRVLLFPVLALNFHRVLRVAPTPWTLAIGLLVALSLCSGLAATWRWARPLFPWASWVPLMLLPPLVSVFYTPAPERGFFTAERFLYLPSVGWCVLLGALVARVLGGHEGGVLSRWGWVTFGSLLLGYAELTVIRLLPWADPVALYVAMRSQPGLSVPMQVLVHNNLGQVYLDRGQLPAAREQFQAVLRLRPDHAAAHNNMGVLLIRERQPVDARRWLEAVIRLDPTYGDTYGNLGRAYEATGDLQAARRVYEAGPRMAPDSAWLASGLARMSAESARTRLPQVRTS